MPTQTATPAARPPANIYTRNGYKDRDDYLDDLACNNGIDRETVDMISDVDSSMLRIKINTENDAFRDNPQAELRSIILLCANLLETHIFDEYDRPLHDLNGNKVGWIKWELDPADQENTR